MRIVSAPTPQTTGSPPAGSSRIAASKLDEALEDFGRAAETLEASVGPDHPWLAIALNYRGNLSLLLGEAMHALALKTRPPESTSR